MTSHAAPGRFRSWYTAVRRLGEARIYIAILILVCLTLAGGLWFQPNRFARTPAYANLLGILPQHTWGLLYGLVAVLLATALIWRGMMTLNLTAFTATITLLLSWWAVFIFRVSTDDSTTVVNVASWGAFLLMAARALWLTVRQAQPAPTPMGA